MEPKEEPRLEGDSISCLLCSELLRSPVTIPCGHSFCCGCIRTHWERQDQQQAHSCPHCGQAFAPRPALVRNTALEDLVEELRETGLGTVAPDHNYAGPEDVPCDVCTGRKARATRSCLLCQASYCGEHLQLHLESPALQEHRLVDVGELRLKRCPHHDDKAPEIHCPTDGRSVCRLCSTEEHETVSTTVSVAEHSERQRRLEELQQEVRRRIRERREELQLLQGEAEGMSEAAERAAGDSERLLTELVHLLKKARSDVRHQIRKQLESEAGRVEEAQRELGREIQELTARDQQLEQLSGTGDHSLSPLSFPSLSVLDESARSFSFHVRPLRYFDDVTEAVTDARDKFRDLLAGQWAGVSLAVSEPDVLLSEPEPRSRAGFLRRFCALSMDPDTAHPHLLLSEGGRKATYMKEQQPHPAHPARFTAWHQVLSRETLTGRRYWEVESRRGGVRVAVAYGSIRRAGRLNECLLGCNDRSWALCCEPNSYTFWHNNVKTPVSGPQPFRVGVYLDHAAGVLSFYSVSDTMTLLHRARANFSQPLHAGLLFYADGDAAEFIQLSE